MYVILDSNILASDDVDTALLDASSYQSSPETLRVGCIRFDTRGLSTQMCLQTALLFEDMHTCLTAVVWH